jgi:NAD(P)-dependent dehydrogenase (short-subunit alcohol dehydrogenase family)
MKYDFTDKVAIVTGTTSGMGQQVALGLADCGARVTASGRNQPEGDRLMEAYPTRIHFISGDVTEPELNRRLVDETIRRWERLDHIVLAAGALGLGRLDQVSPEVWRETFATNVDAVYHLLRHALPLMKKEGGGGSVVIIGSIAAFHAFPNHPAYCASKGALVALVRQLALDFGPEVRLNLICPAQVRTPLLEASAAAFEDPEKILEQTAQRLPLKRLGTAEDIAQSTLFLLSEASSWTTGAHFVVDGGFLAT